MQNKYIKKQNQFEKNYTSNKIKYRNDLIQTDRNMLVASIDARDDQKAWEILSQGKKNKARINDTYKN